jgi:hypothetical protein
MGPLSNANINAFCDRLSNIVFSVVCLYVWQNSKWIFPCKLPWKHNNKEEEFKNCSRLSKTEKRNRKLYIRVSSYTERVFSFYHYCIFQSHTVLFKYFLFKFLFNTRFGITAITSKETTFFSLRTIIYKLLSSYNYHQDCKWKYKWK